MGSGLAGSDGVERLLGSLPWWTHTLTNPTRGCPLGSLGRALLPFDLVSALHEKASITTCPEREGTCPKSPREEATVPGFSLTSSRSFHGVTLSDMAR